MTVSETDDAYIRGVVDYVYEAFTDHDITFWFAGHSFGGFVAAVSLAG